tara:strand:+ start:1372 stop:1605 length:234 start_codon:yes stop_codon:yes gene_type:complete
MEELTELIQTLWKDEMISSHAYVKLLKFTNTHQSIKLMKTDVVGQSEQFSPAEIVHQLNQEETIDDAIMYYQQKIKV